MSSSAWATTPALSRSRQQKASGAMTSIVANHRRPRVVIIGAGFGGLSAARRLAQGPFDVVVVDRHNYHLFQPLLYQVATAGLSPADIASPICGILRGQTNASVTLAKVSGVGCCRQGTRRRRPAHSVRLPHCRNRGRARLFRQRLVILCAGPEDHRRRDLYTPPDTARLRAGRERARHGRAEPASEFRRDRRRPDRRGDGRRHRGIRRSGRWHPISGLSTRVARGLS